MPSTVGCGRAAPRSRSPRSTPSAPRPPTRPRWPPPTATEREDRAMTQPDQIVTETPHITETFRGGSLSLREVQKSFGTARVLNGVSFDVASGQVVRMIGPSGSGKSTALRCINRLEEPTGGGNLLDGGNTLRQFAG